MSNNRPNTTRTRPQRANSFVDYFANTSLDESDTTFAPPELGQGRDDIGNSTFHPRPPPPTNIDDFEARHRRRLHALYTSHEQQTMDHLVRHREYANALTAKYHAATADWQVTHPEAANRFQEFAKLCMAASATPVLAIDLILLLAKAPTAVLKALQNLSKHFHIEAYLRNELHMSDGDEDAALSIMLPEEIHAARETEIAIQCGPDHAPHVKVEQMTRFGGIGDTEAIQRLPDYDKHYTHLGRRQQLLHIQCNFLIRQQVLVDIKRDRFPVTVFEKSYDYFVMEWVLAAHDFLYSHHAVFNKDLTSLADRKLYNKVVKQLDNYAKTRKWFEIEAMRDEVHEYEKQLKAQNARKQLVGYDQHAQAEMDLNQQLDNCETDFEGFEAIHGLVLGSRWATLADGRKDDDTVMSDGRETEQD